MIVKSALNEIYQFFFSSLVVSKINSMNLFYGNFRIQEQSFASLQLNNGFYETHVKTGAKTIRSVFSLEISLSSICIEVKHVRKKADPGIGRM